MLVLAGGLLVAEVVYTGFWLARLLPGLAAYGPATFAIIGVRALVSAVQLTTGWRLVCGDRSAAPLARVALVAAAVLITLELGFRLSPSSVLPGVREPIVAGYWAYALASRWAIARAVRRHEES